MGGFKLLLMRVIMIFKRQLLMHSPLRQFLIQQLYLTLAVYLLGFIAFYFIFPDDSYIFFVFLPAIFYGVMAVFHGSLILASRQAARKFPSRFLAIFGAKILLLLIFIITYTYFNPGIAIPFLVSFLFLYLVYTIFEITALYRHLRQ